MNDTLLVEGETGVTRLVSNRPDVPETLGEACRRALARRRARESVDGAVITIEPVGIAGKESEFLGVAIIDQQWRNDIHNGESTVFRVRPGEHTVTVYFKSRPRGLGWRGLAKASRRVVVGPGERLDLALGVAKESTDVERSKVPVPMFLLFASFFLAFGIGWHISPILREIVVWATRALEIQRPWSSLFYFVVAEPCATALFVFHAWLIIFLLCGEKLQPRSSGLRPGPGFLVRKTETGTPLPLFKTPYVDPFE